MSITELIEQLNAMPERMQGFNSEGELIVLNTHKLAESLEQSLRNCDVGTAEEQYNRFVHCCTSRKMPCRRSDTFSCTKCYAVWSQMPYEEGGAK